MSELQKICQALSNVGVTPELEPVQGSPFVGFNTPVEQTNTVDEDGNIKLAEGNAEKIASAMDEESRRTLMEDHVPDWNKNRVFLLNKLQRTKLSIADQVRIIVGYLRDGKIKQIGTTGKNGVDILIYYTCMFNDKLVKRHVVLKNTSNHTPMSVSRLIDDIMREMHVIGRNDSINSEYDKNKCSVDSVGDVVADQKSEED